MTEYTKFYCAERHVFITLLYTVSLRIHVEFLNDKRGKGKTGDAVACTID